VNCHKADLDLEILNNLSKMQTKGGKNEKKIRLFVWSNWDAELPSEILVLNKNQ